MPCTKRRTSSATKGVGWSGGANETPDGIDRNDTDE